MLLTSSQVSVAISSFIGTVPLSSSSSPLSPLCDQHQNQTNSCRETVFFFTLALFLSGYVLQQQTIKDLRAAIKPQMVRPPPELQLYLPPRFRDDEDESDGKGTIDALPSDNTGNGEIINGIGGEVNGNGERQGEEDDDMVGATRWQKAKRRKEKAMRQKALDAEKNEKQSSSADSEMGGAKSPPKPEEKPLSRAERRKKIKEEIMAAGDGESVTGYRRRMW
ncbi:hypothetical protein G7Y89_g9700 [Cudoniella acicularis]|uniref:Uncharacterized protein n=1 Tax=Cudoniella acicularis TaxID=354080 RepID=A0A8H4VZR9_9HELO|nr:hypothetical protein G7Y89_g9700 [Cudoniella acicularis]